MIILVKKKENKRSKNKCLLSCVVRNKKRAKTNHIHSLCNNNVAINMTFFFFILNQSISGGYGQSLSVFCHTYIYIRLIGLFHISNEGSSSPSTEYSERKRGKMHCKPSTRLVHAFSRTAHHCV